jgi:hypothetical protein
MVARGLIPPCTAVCGPLPIAMPAPPPHYVLPGSHLLDPGYWQVPANPNPWRTGWPLPRVAWPGESESRAAGTGLVAGRPLPCPPPPSRFSHTIRRWGR